MSLFTEIVGFVATPHAVAAFSVIVNIVLWRALNKESVAKDSLYEKYLTSLVEIISDYHEFAHTIDAYVETQRARASSGQGSGGTQSSA